MGERLSVIAGSGALAPEVIAEARAMGHHVQVLSLRGRLGLGKGPVVPLDLSDMRPALEAVRAFGSTIVTMAGAVRLDDRARSRLAALAGQEATAVGDAALSALAGLILRETGARLIGVHELVPGLLAPQGLIAGPAPSSACEAVAVHALELARRAGVLDLGQGIVVSGRRVVALEDIAGTDALLKRVRAYRRHGLAADGNAPLIFAKAAKPDQPLFVDLPAIGPRTVAHARRAGVTAIAVQAGATILIERVKLAAAANAARIPLLGIVPTHG